MSCNFRLFLRFCSRKSNNSLLFCLTRLSRCSLYIFDEASRQREVRLLQSATWIATLREERSERDHEKRKCEINFLSLLIRDKLARFMHNIYIFVTRIIFFIIRHSFRTTFYRWRELEMLLKITSVNMYKLSKY